MNYPSLHICCVPNINDASESLNDLAHLEFDIVNFYMKILNESIEL
jgi:hypothetical protein